MFMVILIDYGGLRSRKYTPNRLIQEFEKTHPQYLIGLMNAY